SQVGNAGSTVGAGRDVSGNGTVGINGRVRQRATVDRESTHAAGRRSRTVSDRRKEPRSASDNLSYHVDFTGHWQLAGPITGRVLEPWADEQVASSFPDRSTGTSKFQKEVC